MNEHSHHNGNYFLKEETYICQVGMHHASVYVNLTADSKALFASGQEPIDIKIVLYCLHYNQT